MPERTTRRVLVVDDQPMLTKAIRRMLSVHDVTVSSAATDALARIEAGERFDLILSDLMMPVMTGMELHGAIARIAPEQTERMVFMTGGAFTEDARQFCARVGVRSIEKPFDRAALAAVIGPLLA